MYSRALGLAFLLFSVTCSLAQVKELNAQSGSIQGIVLNENGVPVDHAMVCINVFSKTVTKTRCEVSTDQSGQFELRNLSLGAFHVFATKEDDGYSSLNQGPGQRVFLTASKPTESGLTIRLAPRSGILIGTVRDKATGKAIDRIDLRYVAVDQSMTGNASGYSGEFTLNLPAARDFIFFVSAPGYRSWFYVDPSSRPSLRLESGEKKTLEVEMEANSQSDH